MTFGCDQLTLAANSKKNPTPLHGPFAGRVDGEGPRPRRCHGVKPGIIFFVERRASDRPHFSPDVPPPNTWTNGILYRCGATRK